MEPNKSADPVTMKGSFFARKFITAPPEALVAASEAGNSGTRAAAASADSVPLRVRQAKKISPEPEAVLQNIEHPLL